MKHTKIVSTLGPSANEVAVHKRLIRSGVNVARLNFSHGDHEEHQARIQNFRNASKELDVTTALLQDLAGPKIRLGDFADGAVTLQQGKVFSLTSKKVDGDEKIVSIKYTKLPKEVSKGDTLMVDDGKLMLEVMSTDGTTIKTKVIVGGKIKSRRGVNVPGADLSIKTISTKDKKDALFGIEQNVDFMALSFVRSAKDVTQLQGILKKNGGEHIKVIAKIETTQAVEQYDEILEVADGIMIARGDLALEIPAEEVPSLQKRFIWKAVEAGKPVITATQMLESMVSSPIATRAEVSDVANAVYDETDAVMLSGETAQGDYPVDAVSTMARVVKRAERDTEQIDYADVLPRFSITESVTAAVEAVASDTEAKAIIVFTKSGYSARMVSRLRSHIKIIAITPDEHVARQLCLSRNVVPLHVPQIKNLENGLDSARTELKKIGFKKGDVLVVTGSYPFKEETDNTNLLVVEEL
jgi:pyruvate kinase